MHDKITRKNVNVSVDAFGAHMFFMQPVLQMHFDVVMICSVNKNTEIDTKSLVWNLFHY